MSSRISLPWLVAVVIFAVYLAAARGPRNLFPLSVFDMYQGHAPTVVARVLVVDSRGETRELDAFEAWSCEWEADLLDPAELCGPEHQPLGYVVRDQSHYLEAHTGRGDEAVSIVSRAYTLRDADDFEDCKLARCRARRRQ